MDKKRAIEEVIKELERQKSELDIGMKSAEQAAIDSPGAMQSHSDTTKSQMHTLAANIGKMIKEKKVAIKYLNDSLNRASNKSELIEEGELIEVQDEDGSKKFYLLVSGGGAGAIVKVGDISVTSLTIRTPLGSALMGKKIGDTATLQNKTGNRNLKILNVY